MDFKGQTVPFIHNPMKLFLSMFVLDISFLTIWYRNASKNNGPLGYKNLRIEKNQHLNGH